MIGYPVILSSPITLGSPAGSLSSPDDPSALICPSKRAMLVEEIRVRLVTPGVAAPHEWEITSGKAQITEGLVPIRLCARIENPPHAYQAADLGGFVGENYLWTFPRPMYVPVGKLLKFRLRSACDDLSAVVAVRARVLPDDYPEPAQSDVPYATVFRPPPVTMSADESDPKRFVYRSGAGDLSNPHHSPLHVQRLTAWADDLSGIGRPDYASWQPPGTPSAVGVQYGSGRFFGKVQIYDAAGNPIARDPMDAQGIRLLDLCTGLRGSWEIPFVLAPKQSIYATMDLTHKAVPMSYANFQCGLGMLGWHTMPVAEVS